MAQKKKDLYYKTTKPSGLSISRNKGAFSNSWKVPNEGYGNGVKFAYTTHKYTDKKTKKKKDRWVNYSLAGGSTSKTIYLDYTDYYPYSSMKIDHFKINVQGHAKDYESEKYKNHFSASSWSSKTFDIEKPFAPSVSISRSTAYTTGITITPLYTDSSNRWATQIQYQTGWYMKKGKKWPKKISWSKTHKVSIKSSHSFTINDAERSYEITNYSVVRYVRARVCGPAGHSSWVTKHFSYAGPEPADGVHGKVTDATGDSVYCTVSFNYYHYNSRPVSSIKIQYAFAPPEATDLSSEGADWEDAQIGGSNTMKPAKLGSHKSGKYEGKVSFKINEELQENVLLYVRVVTIHNNKETVSREALCKDSNGKIPNKNKALSKPTIDNVTPPPPGSNKIIVELTNNCTTAGARIAIRFLPDKDTGYKDMTIWIIETNPPDQSQEYTRTIEIPPDYNSSFRIAAIAFIGTYKRIAKVPENYDTLDPPVPGYRKYSYSAKLKSAQETYGGSIPMPPEDVSVEHLGDGNVAVTWDWKWREADSAEVAWSDYPDALDSNEQPSTYTVSNQKDGRVIIRNLEMGKTWYFWVRLVKGENTSIWSDSSSASLTSSPNIPSLSLSSEYITMDDTVTASWAYVSTDGSKQASAKICLCELVDGQDPVYGDIVAEIPNEDQENEETQYVILDPKSDKLGWSSGNSYSLALKVTSQSGSESEDWSEIQTVNIVDPITSNIISSSLTPSVDVYDPSSTYSQGDYVLRIVPDNTDNNRDIASLYKSLVDISIAEEWNDEHWAIDQGKLYLELTQLPLIVNTEVGGDDVVSSLKIERSQDYFVDRPDNGVYGGYFGEVVYESDESVVTYQYQAVQDPTIDDIGTYYEYDQETQTYILTTDQEIVSGKTYYTQYNGLRTFTITQDDLFGYVDDGATYYLTYRTEDQYGQYSEMRYEFVTKWDHQAIMPEAEVTIDHVVTDYRDYDVAKIKINNPDPQYVVSGDVCDIYRISADDVVLLYQDAVFGETYVDPYPTIGEHGGHRIVFKTLYGDYITEDGMFAWTDFRSDESDDFVYSDGNIIDFGDESVKVMFNLDLNNNWSKDFAETKYLGGSIQGDWNDGVSMTSTISTNVITSDWDTISKLRNLAKYVGICHVRTRDGMNYLADVEVSERLPYEAYFDPQGSVTNIAEYSLNITKIDPIETDGMTLKDWEEDISDAEIPVDP